MPHLHFIFQGIFNPQGTTEIETEIGAKQTRIIRPQGRLLLPGVNDGSGIIALGRNVGLEQPEFRRLNDLYRLASEFRRVPEDLKQEIAQANEELLMALAGIVRQEIRLIQ